jgi:hypothetical protein
LKDGIPQAPLLRQAQRAGEAQTRLCEDGKRKQADEESQRLFAEILHGRVPRFSVLTWG